MGDMSEYYDGPQAFIVGAELDPRKWWTSQTGGSIRIDTMADAHLHYALAKAYRGEYQDTHNRKVGIKALQAEAVRRLLPGGNVQNLSRTANDELRDLRQKLCEQGEQLADARAKNAKLSKIVDKYQQTRAGLGLPPVEV